MNAQNLDILSYTSESTKTLCQIHNREEIDNHVMTDLRPEIPTLQSFPVLEKCNNISNSDSRVLSYAALQNICLCFRTEE